jgi:hypothetical protein
MKCGLLITHCKSYSKGEIRCSMTRHPAKIILRRSINLSKTHVLLSIAIAANGILVSSLGPTLSEESPFSANINVHAPLALLAIPFMATGALALTIPIVLLFVYDKNNGVLERFLSLGMDQSDIYRRYLKASIMLALIFLPLTITAFLVAGRILGTNMIVLLEVSGVLIVLSLSVVTLVSMSMMSFSSLQKERVGANQPVGVGIGGLVVLPYYVIPFGWPLQNALILELGIALGIGAVSVTMLFLSSRLISREKLLP